MVDIADVPKINALQNERITILRTQDLLHDGGRIVAMTVGRQPPSPPRPPQDPEPLPPMLVTATVSTIYMDYPQQMVSTIEAFMTARLGQIDAELAAIGVTGVAAAERR